MRPAPDILASLFEGAPRFVGRLSQECVESVAELLDRAEQILATMPEDEQIELLNSHPRIGDDPASVSPMSYREQGYDRDSGTAELQERLDELNEQYEHAFGFRFVVFVNGRSRGAIADMIEDRMEVSREAEKTRALKDVIDIARSRLAKLAPEEVR